MNQTQITTLLLPKEAVQPMFEITQTTELISGVKHLELAKQTLRIGAGLFMGRHPTRPNLKAFSKTIAQVNLLCSSWNILHAEMLLEKTDSCVRAKQYFKVHSYVLVENLSLERKKKKTGVLAM